jgi:hypothetical protein
MYALKVVASMGLLFGHPVMAHLGMPSSIPAHWQNLSILLNCGCICFISFVIMARSSAYAAELRMYCDVLSLYPGLSLSSHLSSGSRVMMKRYGLNVSPCMVPLCMWTGLVLPKCDPKNIVDELEYMFPIRLMASCGYPRSAIMDSSLAWSIEPNALKKSMCNRYMSYWVSFESSSAAISVCSCLDVHCSCLNPSWLFCRIWYFSP